MKTLNLSGFKQGDGLSLSVSQNALTAGPVNVPAWGNGGDGRDGGTIAITVDRTTLKCAPDSVRFGVDLSTATFDTQGPTGSEVYDARLHDLIYLWDFDDPGTWETPVNVLTAWRNRSTAKGPWVAHMYTVPKPASLGAGNGYNVSVLVIEPSSGKTATANVEVFVEDPDEFYSSANTDPIYGGARTICINPIGDSDFSGAPSGAKTVNADVFTNASSVWTDEQTPLGISGGIRWLFKRDRTFDFSIEPEGNDNGPMMFGAYGSGAHPILNVPSAQTGGHQLRFDAAYMSYGPYWGSSFGEARVQGLDFRSAFDPTVDAPGTTGLGVALGCVYVSKQMNILIDNCRMSGFAGTTVEHRFTPLLIASHGHTNDTLITDFGGQYTWYSPSTSHPDTTMVLTGSAIVQNPLARWDENGARGPVRLNNPGKTHMRCVEVFHTDPAQPCVKHLETVDSDGRLVNMHSCSLEGGLFPLSFCGNTTSAGIKRLSAHNLIVDGVIIVGMARTQFLVRTRATGLSLRNCLIIQPATPYLVNGLDAVIGISDALSQSYDPDVVGAAPISAYNNTIRMDRTSVQNKDRTKDYRNTDFFFLENNAANLTMLSQGNNVFDYEYQDTPYTGDRPLSTTALWTPRNIGRVDPLTLVLDTSYATPSGAVKDTKPRFESAALGTALSGDVAYMDITMQQRPEPPSMGAWEAD